MKTEKRAYRMVARAEAAEDTVRRVREAATAQFLARDYAEITLEEIAGAAGVTLQTVLRRFGSKEGVLEACVAQGASEIHRSRMASAGDVATALERLVDSYEAIADANWRWLRQEHQFEAVHTALIAARESHRIWIETVFAGDLDGLPRAERVRRERLLFAATDFYLFKLWRRDLGMSKVATREAMGTMVEGVVATFSSRKGRP